MVDVIGVLFLVGTVFGASLDDTARAIERQVVSPCCYSQTVDQHRSGAASDVCKEIRRLLGEGYTEQAVIDALVEGYGTKILAVPGSKRFNASIWWMSVAVVGLGAIGLRAYLSRTASQERQNPGVAPRSGAAPFVWLPGQDS